jgi:hypothetical protein
LEDNEMKKSAVALAALLALAVPAVGSAQLSVGARAGTMGLGGEVSFGLGRMLALRGGIGFVPYTYNDAFEGVNYEVTAPERIWNVGVDVYPLGGGLRLSAGVLNRPSIDLEANGQQSATIGGRQYTGNLDIQGSLTNEKETAPYATIGFGRASGRGVGFFVDVGAAFVGEGEINLTGSCTETTTGQPCPEFDQRLQQEEDEANAQLDDFGSFVKVHPILQIGIRIGL